METDYDKQLRDNLADAQRRVEQAVAAKKFLKTPEGKLIQDWINERISYEMERMTAKSAMDRDEYLEGHGAIRILKDFNVMLNSKARQEASAVEEVQILNEQQRAVVAGQEPVQFSSKA